MTFNLSQNVRWVSDIKYELQNDINKQAICPICSNILNYNFEHSTYTKDEMLNMKEFRYMECDYGCKNLIAFENIHLVFDYNC